MKITMMPTGDLRANDYNPNRMTKDEFAEFVAEVKRTGHLPKPILVRQNGAVGAEIVDGEHAWKAATQLGIAEVPVEVEDMDDVEAMLQTLKRNQHGTGAVRGAADERRPPASLRGERRRRRRAVRDLGADVVDDALGGPVSGSEEGRPQYAVGRA